MWWVSRGFVSVKQEGKRVHIQKRLVLSNLRDVYREFNDQFPASVSQSSLIYALNIVSLLETHSVCVCPNPPECQVDDIGSEALYSAHIPTFLQRSPPLPSCYLGDCNFCPALKDDLITYLSRWKPDWSCGFQAVGQNYAWNACWWVCGTVLWPAFFRSKSAKHILQGL